MKTSIKWKQLFIAAAAGVQFTFPALAADGSIGDSAEAAEITALKQQVETLLQKVNALEQQRSPAEQSATIQDRDQQVCILQRQREFDQDAAVVKEVAAPKVTLSANGFSFSSADSNFVTQIHGVVQVDSRTFFKDNDAKGVDGFLLRRARAIFSGTVFRYFDYLIVPDYGGSTVQIPDAYVSYRYAPEFQMQVGKLKSPIGLEHLQSDRDTLFNERSLATDLVPNRDLGILFKGDLYGGVASYTLGLLNGASDYNGTTTNTYSQNDKAFVAHTFFLPWKNSDMNALRGFGFGVAGSYELDDPNTNSAAGLPPGYATDGQQKFFAYNKNVYADGRHWRVSPQSYYYYGPLGLLGEYVISNQRVSNGINHGDINNTAWDISVSWLLTGEDATYAVITPRHNFDPRNGEWGAFQVVARYAELKVDTDVFTGGFSDPAKSAAGAQAWAIGFNWYLNKNIRANLSYSRTTYGNFKGMLESGAVASHPENVLFSRLQLAF